MNNIDFLEVPNLIDKNGVHVKNNDILRIECIDQPQKYRFIRVGFGTYVDDNTLETHIGFYAASEGYTVTLGQIVGHSENFKIVGNRLNYIYSKGHSINGHDNSGMDS